MKLTKKMFALFMVILIALSQTAVYAENMMETDLQLQGAVLSREDFNRAFVGEDANLDPQSCKSFAEVKAEIQGLRVSGKTVTFRLVVYHDGRDVSQSFVGEILRGRKNDKDIYSLVGRFSSDNETEAALRVILMNSLGANDDSLLFAKHLNMTSHMKLYLEDEDGKLLFFETETPAVLKNYAVESLETDNSDYTWALPFVMQQPEEIDTTPEIATKMGIRTEYSTMALDGYSTWTNSKTFTLHTTIAGDPVHIYSLPYVEYKHTNVNSQPGSWTASFKVAEHTNYNGETLWGNNVFQYTGVDIRFSAGSRTYFTSFQQQGSMIQSTFWGDSAKQNGGKIAITLLSKASGTFGEIISYTQAVNNLFSALSTDHDVYLGSTYSQLLPERSRVAGHKLKDINTDYYYLDKCTNYNGGTRNGHYYMLQVTPQYDGVSGGSINTSGCLRVDFLMRSTSDLDNPVSCSTGNIELAYRSYSS